MKIIVSGTSGLVGSKLVPLLISQGHTVKKLVRKKDFLASDEIPWDPQAEELDPKHLEDCEAVVNLSGENIASGRWTSAKKQRIASSRISSTKLLSEVIKGMEKPPGILVNASAMGFYGNRGDEVLTEDSSVGKGFLADLCCTWEASAAPAVQKGIRVAFLRTGMVLSRRGGGLARMLLPFKLGLGGKIGSGEQIISWIAIDDLVNIIAFILKTGLSGPVNAVSPNPVSNKEFTKILGSVLHRPTVVALPAFAARIAFGEIADALLLSSTKAIPAKLQNAGFEFKYPSLEAALKHCLLPFT
jgi:uncharacterized protein